MKKTIYFLTLLFCIAFFSCSNDDDNNNSGDAILLIETLDLDGNPKQGIEISVELNTNLYPNYDYPTLITDQNGKARYIPEDFFFDDDETPTFYFEVPFSINNLNFTSGFTLTAIKGETVSRTIQDQ